MRGIYFKLTSALLPLRLACSGGNIKEGQIKRKAVSGSLTGNELEIDEDLGEVCPICLDTIEHPRATLCKTKPHIYCKECIEGVFKSKKRNAKCPYCRAEIKASDMRDVVVKETPDEIGNEDGNEGAAVETAVKDTVDNKQHDSKSAKKKKNKRAEIKASDMLFRTKFERLLQELRRIRNEEPGSKSLVFSQFKSTLRWMQQELPRQGFQFRTLSGDMTMQKRAQALREFQNDPSTTIFLLSMRSGAVGINLTQANRVFLMEPAMNPALEAQAIGRVYRLGQKKPVQVIKMRIKNSFESRLVEILKHKYCTASKPESSKPDEEDASLSAADGDGENDKEDRQQGTNNVAAAVSLGHMTRDKVDLMMNEFDNLFGV